MPFERYLRRAPRTVHIPSLKMAQAKLMLYECYEKKIAADLVDDRVRSAVPLRVLPAWKCGRSLSGYLVYQNNVPREPMPKFMFNFFMQKYGLHSLSHGYLFALVRLLKLNDGLDKQKSLRMHLFSMAAGLHEKSGAGYTVLLMDVMLNLLKALVPKFSATKYANHKYARRERCCALPARCGHTCDRGRERRCFVTFNLANDVVDEVFPQRRIPFNVLDKLELPRGMLTRTGVGVWGLDLECRDRIP